MSCGFLACDSRHCNEATEVHNGEFVEATVYLNPILPGIICHLSIKM